jgi:hypothetical protein
MRLALTFVTLLLVAVSSRAADTVYLDELIESPLSALQARFPELRKEGCYRVGENRYLLITMDKKSDKPWRVTLASAAPCRKPIDSVELEVRHRGGVELGHSTLEVVTNLGRPDASADPDKALQRLGEIEYFYICRVSEGCARHSSVFIRDGVVSAISEWYSE